MKGRKPKDLAMKLLSGNPGKRSLSGSGQEPFTRSEIAKPSGLDTLTSEEWDRLTEHLAPILSTASTGMLLVAASAYSQMMSADAIIQKEGMTYRTVGEAGPIFRMRPEVRIRDSARAAYHRALAELGASPVAHTRVHRLPDENQAELPGIARLLG